MNRAKSLFTLAFLSIALVMAYLLIGFFYPTEEEVRQWVFIEAGIGLLILFLSFFSIKKDSRLVKIILAMVVLVNFLMQILPALLWFGYDGKRISDKANGFIASWAYSLPHIGIGLLSIYIFGKFVIVRIKQGKTVIR